MPSVQESLRRQRLRLGQSLGTAAAVARLPQDVPGALESGALPLDEAASLAYLRIYARHLGLDAEELLRECDANAHLELTEDQLHDVAPPRRGPLQNPRIRPAVVLGAIVLLCAVLAGVLWRGADDGAVDVVALVPSASPTPGATDADAASERSSPSTDEPAGTEEPADADGSGSTDQPVGTDGTGGTVATDDTVNAGDSGQVGQPDAAPPSQGAADALPGRPPAQTRVQILHHRGDPAVVEEVRALLTDLGYQVTHVNELREPNATTTVRAVEGWMVEAEALRSRDGRFAAVGPNHSLSTEVHLHVLLGTDWPDGT